MKTTLDLPDDLVCEVVLRAAQEGLELPETMARLLRKGLAAGLATVVTADEEMLRLRKELTQKFVSGEWGVELDGFEAGRAADRRKSEERSTAWGN